MPAPRGRREINCRHATDRKKSTLALSHCGECARVPNLCVTADAQRDISEQLSGRTWAAFAYQIVGSRKLMESCCAILLPWVYEAPPGDYWGSEKWRHSKFGPGKGMCVLRARRGIIQNVCAQVKLYFGGHHEYSSRDA